MKAKLKFASGVEIEGEIRLGEYLRPTDPNYQGPDKNLPDFYEWSFSGPYGPFWGITGRGRPFFPTREAALADFQRFGEIVETDNG